jgi:tetratricopeptide (TPR) repeat protein
MKSTFPFLLILLIALAPSFPAHAQKLPQRNIPSAQRPAARQDDDSIEVVESPKNVRTLRWAIGTAKVLGMVAVGWLVILLLMSWASGQKPRKRDALFIAAAVLVLLAIRYASYYLTNNFMLLLEHPRLFSLWPILRALGGAYIIALAVIFLTSLGYGLRRAFTKRQISRGGIIWWGLSYSAVLFGLMGSNRVVSHHAVYLTLALGFAVVWLCCNPGMIVSQLAEYYNSKGQLQKSMALQEKMLARPRLSAKTRFTLLNDYASNLQSLGEWHRALEVGEQALQFAPAFQSAEVLLRANLAECHLFLGQLSAAVEQCAEMFRLTKTTSCVGGAGVWAGVGHAMLAAVNLRRGWLDEAGRQADLCLEKIPPEAEKGTLHRNVVVLAKSVQASLMLAANKPKAAARLCRQALKRKPRFLTAAHLRTLYATALMADCKYDEAAEQCKLALTACEKWPEAHFCLGEIQRAQDKEEEARRSFETVISIYPEHPCATRARQALSQPVFDSS